MDSWNSIFKEKGKVFTKPHRDMNGIADLLKERNAIRILDLGSGTGRHLVFFASNGFEVHGLDASPEGIEIAKKWLAENNLNYKISLHRMEERFPYDDSFFDAVISIQVLHHNKLKKIKFTIREIKRVLQPDGLIFITVPIGKFSNNKPSGLQKIEKGTYLPLAGPEKGLPHHLFTEREIYKVFKGFNIEKVYLDRSKHRAILGFRK